MLSEENGVLVGFNCKIYVNRFSAMTTDEKNSAMAEWQRRWNDFILNKYEDYKTKHNLI